MQKSCNQWHLVSWKQDQIDKLISFCENKEILEYAYIKHHPRNPEGKVHYHFYFKFKRNFTLDFIKRKCNIEDSFMLNDNLNGMIHHGDHFSILRYFVRGNSYEFAPSKEDLVTNIRVNMNLN